ncbi:MAG: hypothetical protein JRI96_18650 [Deltaproteobacteria bacterium]|nr:hypothetical protein [Deltaproteobacteria bacterium]
MYYIKEFFITIKKVIKLCWLFVFWKARDLNDYFLIFGYDLKIRLGFNKRVAAKGFSKQPKIHCVYFTCSKDFEYLLISLKSLERLNLDCLGNVYLYMDKKDPLNDSQINKLKKELKPNIIIRKTKYKGSRAGLGFEVIIDYIAKIDSDILFISDKIFREAIGGNSDAVGQGKINLRLAKPFLFMQGGCYFLKGSGVSKVIRQPVRKAVEKASGGWRVTISICPEDRAISEILEQSGAKINFTSKYFPTRGIHNNNPIDEYLQQYSVIHFTAWSGWKKEQMLEAWEKICKEN